MKHSIQTTPTWTSKVFLLYSNSKDITIFSRVYLHKFSMNKREQNTSIYTKIETDRAQIPKSWLRVTLEQTTVISLIEWSSGNWFKVELSCNWAITECWSNEGGWGGSSSLVIITHLIDNPHFDQKRIWPKRANFWLPVHSDTWTETDRCWLESS